MKVEGKRVEVLVGDIFISKSNGSKITVTDRHGALIEYKTEDGITITLPNTRFLKIYKKQDR